MFVNLLRGKDLGKEMSLNQQRRHFSAQQILQLASSLRQGKRAQLPEDAQRVLTEFVTCYNHERLHSAIGYFTPKYTLEGRAETIQAARDAKLAADRFPIQAAHVSKRLNHTTRLGGAAKRVF